MFHFVQDKVQWGRARYPCEITIQLYKKRAEEWEDKVKKNEEEVKRLEQRREQYEGEW